MQAFFYELHIFQEIDPRKKKFFTYKTPPPHSMLVRTEGLPLGHPVPSIILTLNRGGGGGQKVK